MRTNLLLLALVAGLVLPGCNEEAATGGSGSTSGSTSGLTDGLVMTNGNFAPVPTPTPTPSPTPTPGPVEMVRVPDLYGMGMLEATFTLLNSGLQPGTSELRGLYSDKPPMTTLTQNPLPGASVPVGTVVQTGLSFGLPPTTPYPPADVAPALPSDVQVSRVKSPLGYAFTVTWVDNATNEAAYVVGASNFKKAADGSPIDFYEAADRLPPDSTSFTFSGPFDDPQEVWVSVAAHNAAGTSVLQIRKFPFP